MEPISIVIMPGSDENHDQALPFAEATAEFMSKILGMHVYVDDGHSGTTDYRPEV
jgi:tagatose-1,6-bisphosphate aldolase non-catalytic subunit AgaZ/GatZ